MGRVGGGNEGRQESERGGGGEGSLAIVPVSPCFSPIFHTYDLTCSPPSECRLLMFLKCGTGYAIQVKLYIFVVHFTVRL